MKTTKSKKKSSKNKDEAIKSEGGVETKIYRFYGIDTAIELLRPNAKWEWTGGVGFTRWEDARPKPSKEEVEETMEKIKAFEDSINTIWTEEQLKEFGI